jgi:vacuolar-type H+-ATPase subunit I/STV1
LEESLPLRWLYVTGIALDASGALLVIGAIVLSRSADIGHEALTRLGFSSDRVHARANERGFAWAGGFLLLLGFLLQLVGYAWSFDSLWLLGYAAGVIAIAVALGVWGARELSRAFERSATRAAEAAIEETDRAIEEERARRRK